MQNWQTFGLKSCQLNEEASVLVCCLVTCYAHLPCRHQRFFPLCSVLSQSGDHKKVPEYRWAVNVVTSSRIWHQSIAWRRKQVTRCLPFTSQMYDYECVSQIRSSGNMRLSIHPLWLCHCVKCSLSCTTTQLHRDVASSNQSTRKQPLGGLRIWGDSIRPWLHWDCQ